MPWLLIPVKAHARAASLATATVSIMRTELAAAIPTVGTPTVTQMARISPIAMRTMLVDMAIATLTGMAIAIRTDMAMGMLMVIAIVTPMDMAMTMLNSLAVMIMVTATSTVMAIPTITGVMDIRMVRQDTSHCSRYT